MVEGDDMNVQGNQGWPKEEIDLGEVLRRADEAKAVAVAALREAVLRQEEAAEAMQQLCWDRCRPWAEANLEALREALEAAVRTGQAPTDLVPPPQGWEPHEAPPVGAYFKKCSFGKGYRFNRWYRNELKIAKTMPEFSVAARAACAAVRKLERFVPPVVAIGPVPDVPVLPEELDLGG